MARPKHTDPELFTSGEISQSTGLTIRNLQYLRDNELTPQSQYQDSPRYAANLYDTTACVHFSLVYALQNIGITLTPAAKVAMHVRDAMDADFGRVSQMNNWPHARSVRRDHSADWPQTENSYFWVHHWARRDLHEGYAEGVAWPHDIILEIADSRFVMFAARAPLLKTIDPLCELVGSLDGEVIPVMEPHDCQIRRFEDARQNAVGLSRINVSLAVRNVFDRIHDLRMANGGKLFGMT